MTYQSSKTNGSRKIKLQNYKHSHDTLSLFPKAQNKIPSHYIAPLHHLNPCTLTASNAHITNSLPTVVTYLHFYWLLTFHCRKSRPFSIA